MSDTTYSNRLFNLELDASGRLIFPDPTQDIEIFRKDKKLTQEAFARLYDMDTRSVKRMESGTNTPCFSENFRHFLADWMEWKIARNSISN